MNASNPGNRIPTLDEACEGVSLTSDRKTHFLRSTDEWRRTYKFSDGSFGKDLVAWDRDQTQKRLSKLSSVYLERDENGKKWWPPSNQEESQPALSYPRDELL